MRGQLKRAVSLMALLLAAAPACRCDESTDTPDAGDTGVPEASVPPEAGLSDAGPDADATLPPDATQHDFCNEPFFKLPIDGQTESTAGISIRERLIAWAKRKRIPTSDRSEVYLLNLQTCVEQVLTSGSEAYAPEVRGDDIFWYDLKDGSETFCSDLYHYARATGEASRLTATAGCEMGTGATGDYLAYSYSQTPTDPPSLRLWNLQTGDDIELSPDWTNIQAEYFHVDEQRVVWVAYTQDPLSVGRDVFYRDLPAGQTQHIDASYDGYQYFPFVWQEWVTWMDMAGHTQYPSGISLYNLATQVRIQLVTDDYAAVLAPIRDGLVAYNTSLYSGTNQLNPSDLEIFEIATGATRRLTTEPTYLRAKAMDPPFMVLMNRLNLNVAAMNDYYIANLELLGVIDAGGNLLPGGPVISPP